MVQITSKTHEKGENMMDTSKEYQKDKSELLSDFNEAKFQIYRLNNLWMGVQALMLGGDFNQAKWKLDAIWRELSADAREKDGCSKNYAAWIEKSKTNPKSYIFLNKKTKLDIAKAKTRTEIYQALEQREVFLRCLQDDAGKGAKRSSSDMETVDD